MALFTRWISCTANKEPVYLEWKAYPIDIDDFHECICDFEH